MQRLSDRGQTAPFPKESGERIVDDAFVAAIPIYASCHARSKSPRKRLCCLDRVSRQLLARAWAAGAGPGDSPLTIDLDSTICETYGLAKEGARHHGYTGARGYHPLLAIAAGTGEVLMSRLREGRANTARGAAHFLRETVGRVALCWGQGTTHGAGRQRLLRPTLSLPPAGKWMSASLSPSASAPACGT